MDPNCRYHIRAKNSFGQTASRIVQQFSQWIPAHLVAILLLALRHQIAITPEKEVFKCGSLSTAYSAGTTFFILTGRYVQCALCTNHFGKWFLKYILQIFISASRLFVKFLMWTKSFPDPDQFKHSLIISFVIHGSALAVLHLLTYSLWFAIALCGNIAYQLIFKITQIPVSAGIVLPAIQKFPITIGTLLVSMVLASCGAVPLICAVIVYFVLIAKMYEDYLEEFVFKTTKLVAQKLFGGKPDTNDNHTKKSNIADDSNGTVGGTVGSDENSDKHGSGEVVNQSTAVGKSGEQSNNLINGEKLDVVAVERENSFEMLFSQLDPEDIAEMTDLEPVVDPNETEEEKQKKLVIEAGSYILIFN